MSSCYETFASVYDTFMDNIPYEEWCSYLVSLFHQEQIKEGTLIELGCGTGTMMQLMKQNHYHIIGIDNSTDMLSIAADKLSAGEDMDLICQDMRFFDLGITVDGIYSICDSINYLLTPDDLCDTFACIRKHLNPNGVFIFDLKTQFFYSEILGDQTFCDHQDNCSYIWENSYFDEDDVNQYDLTIFVKEEDSDLYRRFQETHHQRAYKIPFIIDLLKKSGFSSVSIFDAFTSNAPNPESERIYLIARNGEK